MTDLEEAMLRLREAINILEHPEHPGCCTEAAERIEDALAKLKNVEDAEDQLDAHIEELQKLRRMQKARPVNLTKHFDSLDIDLPDDEPEKERVIIAEEPVEGDDDYRPEEPHIDLTARLERELHKATEESEENHKMDEKPPEREGWIKITDQKAATQKLFDVSDKFDEQEKQYNREEMRKSIRSEQCSDCEVEDNFGENFCPNCGKRLIEEDE